MQTLTWWPKVDEAMNLQRIKYLMYNSLVSAYFLRTAYGRIDKSLCVVGLETGSVVKRSIYFTRPKAKYF